MARLSTLWLGQHQSAQATRQPLRAPVPPRRRRRLVASLRGAAAHTQPSPAAYPFAPLMLVDRVAVVRDDFLRLATMIEHAVDPDPAVLDDLWRLLLAPSGRGP